MAAGVTSDNIVGYNAMPIVADGYNMFSVPFEGVGDNTGWKLNECLSGVNLTGAESDADADWVMLWNPVTSIYENYFYYVEPTHEYDGWWDVATGNMMFEDNYPNGLPAGSSFWYLAKAATTGATATFAGQVPAAETVAQTVNRGSYNLFACPYPINLKLNDATQVSWGDAIGAEVDAEADWIMLWNPTTSVYENYFYYVEPTHEYDGWWDVATGNMMFEDNYPNGLEVGQPFWYLAKGTAGETFTVTFKKTY